MPVDSLNCRAAALDPLFDPTGFGVRYVPVPDAGEQRHDGTGFNLSILLDQQVRYGTPRLVTDSR